MISPELEQPDDEVKREFRRLIHRAKKDPYVILHGDGVELKISYDYFDRTWASLLQDGREVTIFSEPEIRQHRHGGKSRRSGVTPTVWDMNLVRYVALPMLRRIMVLDALSGI